MTASELTLEARDYDMAFTEVSFLLDMFVNTIVTFVGKSTPALAVAAGRRMADNMPVHRTDKTPEVAVAELVRIFRVQQMEIDGRCEGLEAAITIAHCPIGSVCRLRRMEIDGQACQMFHYYLAGILAELAGCPARPRTVATGESCTFNIAFSRARK